ncbi:hypothetical protein [Vibrio rumoiensis]|uniref:Uncharacterized protein n=1 Tax=Vibrio rumoiensis 1S-45 TaxID=1188252 RepID=A0A1E5E1K4_9VIBR|nr:hypothetical protein [Vibrio rumoiensis]OEF24112.1 hypothetical protein A1QC_10735 [Vibrio rumoiensis 1S-45]
MEQQQLQQQLSDMQTEMDAMKVEIHTLKQQLAQLQGIKNKEAEESMRMPIKDSRPKNEWLKIAVVLGGILLWLLLEKYHLL